MFELWTGEYLNSGNFFSSSLSLGRSQVLNKAVQSIICKSYYKAKNHLNFFGKQILCTVPRGNLKCYHHWNQWPSLSFTLGLDNLSRRSKKPWCQSDSSWSFPPSLYSQQLASHGKQTPCFHCDDAVTPNVATWTSLHPLSPFSSQMTTSWNEILAYSVSEKASASSHPHLEKVWSACPLCIKLNACAPSASWASDTDLNIAMPCQAQGGSPVTTSPISMVVLETTSLSTFIFILTV